MDRCIQVLLVDDSPVSLELLSYMIGQELQFSVIGTAKNGEKAIEFLKTQTPDVIIMDIHMPVMDGFEATRYIMSHHPIPIIICSNDYSPGDVSKSFQAIESGALSIIAKPKGLTDPHFPQILHNFIQLVKNVAGVKLITRTSFHMGARVVEGAFDSHSIEAVGIGASLGGPQALEIILSQLPPSFSVPLFIVQHISPEFTEGFVEWLKGKTRVKVQMAKEGETALAGHAYVAPSQYHLLVEFGHKMRLQKDTRSELLCPSATILFDSMARTYGVHAAGIILTGMGRDGVDGLLAMKKKGALTIAQDEASCIMFGMPKEAIQAHAVTKVLPLQEIAPFLLTSLGLSSERGLDDSR